MDRSKTKVSVIIPTYNRCDLIVEAIQSVLDQSLSQVCEILVIDDGSTDNTQVLLTPFIDKEQIRFFKQPNQGQATARNLGIVQSSGDFICFLDSDNRWLPDKIEIQLNYLGRHPEVDIAYGDNYIIDAQGIVISDENMPRFSGHIYKHLLLNNCVSMNTTMSRRHCFDESGGFDTSFRVADDYELWLRLSAKYTFGYIKNYFAEYRVFDAQISSNKSRRFDSNLRAIKKFHHSNPELFTDQSWAKTLSTFYRRWGYAFCVNSQLRLSTTSYRQALVHAPTSRLNWSHFLLMPLRYLKAKVSRN